MNDDDLSRLIHEQATHHKADSRLRAAIQTRITLASAAQPTGASPASHATAVKPSHWREFGWRTALAGFVLGVALTAGLMPSTSRWIQNLDKPLSAELVADHVRALQTGALIQVASTDRHTVKPWFQGKLDFAPTVLNLADEGFPLQGARIEQLEGRNVAVLVYMHNHHVISLFVRPTDGQQPAKRLAQRGFNLLNWADGGMQYWLVSDMDAKELAHFEQAWQTEVGQLH